MALSSVMESREVRFYYGDTVRNENVSCSCAEFGGRDSSRHSFPGSAEHEKPEPSYSGIMEIVHILVPLLNS
jgi:hypothetical protein